MTVEADRPALEARWLELTRHVLPGLANARGWPVRNDHCFLRTLLAAVCGGRWYDHVQGRPAYRAIDADRLAAAIRLAEQVERGEADLHHINAKSLGWRGKDETGRSHSPRSSRA